MSRCVHFCFFSLFIPPLTTLLSSSAGPRWQDFNRGRRQRSYPKAVCWHEASARSRIVLLKWCGRGVGLLEGEISVYRLGYELQTEQCTQTLFYHQVNIVYSSKKSSYIVQNLQNYHWYNRTHATSLECIYWCQIAFYCVCEQFDRRLLV